jgi:predicted permease
VALIYDQLGSFLALSTYGALIVGLYRMDGGRTDARRILINVISFPPFIALVMAIGVKWIPCPPVAVRLFEALAATLVPLTMIVVGYQLVLRMNKALATQLTLGLGIKLVVAPLATLGVCRWLGLQGEAVNVSVFESAMPPMVTAGAMAMLAGLSPKLAAALVAVGVVVSFVTLPLLFYLLHYGG